MKIWSHQLAIERIYNFEKLNANQQDFLIALLNKRFPPFVYKEHRHKRILAQRNLVKARHQLKGA